MGAFLPAASDNPQVGNMAFGHGIHFADAIAFDTRIEHTGMKSN